MLPRRKKKPELATEIKEIDPIEMLQTQINEERTKQARPNSRTQSDRKVISKKKQPVTAVPKEPSEPKLQSPPRPKPRYATTETVTDAHAEISVSAPEIKPLAATGFSYFDRLTDRNIFDDPLKDFPELRKYLEPK